MTNVVLYSQAQPALGLLGTTQHRTNTITIERALQDGVTAASLRAVADRNERKGQPRNIAQARTLRAVADQVEAHQLEASNGTELHREAA